MEKVNNNKRLIATLIISSIFILLSSLVSYASSKDIAGRENKKKVLYISSYCPQFSSYDNQLSGLIKGLGKNVNLQVEYMDYGTFPEDENEINFYNLLKYKINKYKKFDVVILADDHALNFGKKYREELFKDMPIVFFGVNNIQSAKDAVELDNVYGIIEKVPVKQNVELISKLHTNKNMVALIYDKSENSKELKEFYDLQSKYLNLNFKHISLGDISLSQFEDEINKLNEDDIILSFYSYTEDGESFIKMMNSVDILLKNENIPKYTTFDVLEQENFVGGTITSNYKTSEIAADMAIEILNENIPKKKLLYTEDIYANVFEYEELKKYNIDESKLPKDSNIFNKPPSFWEKYEYFIVPTFIIISSLLITIILLIKNIKQRIVYENEILRAKEIAENVNKVQSNFISNISHELRTPVAVIMSSNQLLDLNLSKESKDKNQANINIIRQNCYRLLRLVNNIIDVAKVDSGFMNSQLKNIEIVSLIENLVLSIVPYAKSKDLEVVFDTQEEEIIMSVDPNKIERIILNLLSNSIKFSKRYGKILCSINKENDTLVISIKDNGIGIDKENLDKIFEKFVQVEDIFIRKNEGSGIGLALVKSFVDLHGGSIEVDSKVNEGSIFTIKIPIQLLEGESIHICDLDCMQEDGMSTSIEFSDIYT